MNRQYLLCMRYAAFETISAHYYGLKCMFSSKLRGILEPIGEIRELYDKFNEKSNIIVSVAYAKYLMSGIERSQ